MDPSSLVYDKNAYEVEINQSKRAGSYYLQTPAINCNNCFPTNPEIRLQRTGNSVSSTKPLVDVDSDLMGITKKLSNDPRKQFNPKKDKKDPLKHLKECGFPIEHTRLSNPSCNLRGTGWNRWEWLCKNPQDNVIPPFKMNINESLEARDKFVPCIPKFLQKDESLPPIAKMKPQTIKSNQYGIPKK